MVAAVLTSVVLLLSCKSLLADTLVEVITDPVCNLTCRAVARENVTFLQYLPSGERQQINSSDSLDLNKQTIFVVHGWTNNATMPWIPLLAATLFKSNFPGNVIAVDWSIDAALDYLQSATAVCGVGKIVSDFIITNNITNVYVIGHSMGAQVAAHVGQDYLNSTGQKIGRISGLDPASPLFETMLPQCRLDKEDASFVDVIHTQIAARGMVQPCGQLDFYVNLGLVQFNCTSKLLDLDGFVSCGHQMVTAFFIITVGNPEKYYDCDLGCTDAKKVYMGYGASPNSTGIHLIVIDKDANLVRAA